MHSRQPHDMEEIPEQTNPEEARLEGCEWIETWYENSGDRVSRARMNSFLSTMIKVVDHFLTAHLMSWFSLNVVFMISLNNTVLMNKQL